jgi:hypothetical protein
VPTKAKLVEPAIMDVNAMKLSPMPNTTLTAEILLALFSGQVFSFFLKKFIAHTWMAEISDLRRMPLVMPKAAEARRLQQLAERAMEAKRLTFTGGDAPHALAAQLDRDGADALRRVTGIRARTTPSRTLVCEPADIEAWVAYGSDFAEKLRAGVALATARAMNDPKQLAVAVTARERALVHWKRLARVGRPIQPTARAVQFETSVLWLRSQRMWRGTLSLPRRRLLPPIQPDEYTRTMILNRLPNRRSFIARTAIVTAANGLSLGPAFRALAQADAI